MSGSYAKTTSAMNMQQSSTSQDSFAAEYQVAISRDEAAQGTHRTLRFYGPDGHERVVTIAIPAGSVTGSRVHMAGDESGCAWGQVVAIVTVLPHQRWETRGDDLVLHLKIDRISAIREGVLQIAIGQGRSIAVPVNGGQSYARYIYAGYGMPRSYNTQRNGDLIVQLELLDLPTSAANPASPNGDRRWWRSLFGSN